MGIEPIQIRWQRITRPSSNTRKSLIETTNMTETGKSGGRLKQTATLIASLAALITSITSLVKALDKRVEQASYETTAEAVKELQVENKRIFELLQKSESKSISIDVDADSQEFEKFVADAGAPPVLPSATQISAASAPSSTISKPKSKVSGGSSPATTKSDLPESSHLPPPRPPSKPLPDWDGVKKRAEKMLWTSRRKTLLKSLTVSG